MHLQQLINMHNFVTKRRNHCSCLLFVTEWLTMIAAMFFVSATPRCILKRTVYLFYKYNGTCINLSHNA